MKKKKEEDITVIDPQRAMNLIIVMRKLGNKVSLLLFCFAVVGCCTCFCSLFVKKINMMYVLLLYASRPTRLKGRWLLMLPEEGMCPI
jgi:hypothetical protein